MKDDKETVLLTLEQLSQTMDAMRQVVCRLKRSVEAGANGTVNRSEPDPPAKQARREDQTSIRADVAAECRVESSPTLH